jgi:putative transposase
MQDLIQFLAQPRRPRRGRLQLGSSCVTLVLADRLWRRYWSFMPLHRHLKRLSRVWVPHAVYFITTCTHGRKNLLIETGVADVLLGEWAAARERHGWLIGRYVIMPDHVHFFCAEQAGGAKQPLSRFMERWKEWTSKGLCRAKLGTAPVWQAGFFDHVVRSDESYADKWLYVRENPVRAGMVSAWSDWPLQGWIDFDDPRGDHAGEQAGS